MYHLFVLKIILIETIEKIDMAEISGVSRLQTRCCFMCSYCCCCCINDFANIFFYGGVDGYDQVIMVKNVPNSIKIANKFTRHLQELHKDFRQRGRSWDPWWEKAKSYDPSNKTPEDFLTSASLRPL